MEWRCDCVPLVYCLLIIEKSVLRLNDKEGTHKDYILSSTQTIDNTMNIPTTSSNIQTNKQLLKRRL